MGIAIVLTVVTGIDYVASAVREVRRDDRLIREPTPPLPAFT